jgi:hypothetical protein
VEEERLEEGESFPTNCEERERVRLSEVERLRERDWERLTRDIFSTIGL